MIQISTNGTAMSAALTGPVARREPM